ncbi:hypothetical protein MB27_41275 [Actinoplanes utahensis]|uniref:Uncharacterized protein n=2 Tax=Actinoplanes utahensis TaxID=1869 RepID=A0A0A6U9Y4_ACTUT|nr:hypothetical protein MB27_41275 [Actinoplanes utahensis]
MVLVFLYVAPSNPISERFEQPMNVWVRPFFQQGWGLFAPNPGGVNTQIFARTGWVTASGERQVSDWFDISATDRAGVTHQPYPSRTAQRMLRSAWSQYRKTHDGDDEPRSDQAAVWAKCLRNIAVQRVTPLSPHPFQAIRLWVVTQPVRPSSADKRVEPDPKDRGTRLLPWWNVTPDGN